LAVLLSSEKALKICTGRANKRGDNTTTMVDDQSFESTSSKYNMSAATGRRQCARKHSETTICRNTTRR
jgi:hypothetical protein